MSDQEIVTSAPAGSESFAPAAAPIAAPAVAPTAPQSVAPQAPASGAPQAEPSWIKQRLDETRASTERRLQADFQRREQEYQTKLDQMQNQLRVLVGVNPPANPELQNVRNRFGELYPGLSKLEDRADQLLKLQDRADDLENQNQHYWQSYARQTTERLFDIASKSLGSPLTEEGKRQLHLAFVGYVQQSPETMSRYSTDPSIIDEFWKNFTSSFIDPVRRTAAAGITDRVPGALPQDSPSGAPRPIGAPVQHSNLDDRVASSWAMYNQQKR